MRLLGLTIHTAAVLAVASGLAYGSPYTEDDDEPHVPGPVRDVFLVRDGSNPAERAMKTDLEFTRSMARHHQGAIDMAVYYLNDPRGTHPILRRLAQGIIHNQAFEIGVLDVVRRAVEHGPRPVWGMRRVVALNRGWHGLEHELYFVKAPPPGALELWLSSGRPASVFDVQFARPMIGHHRAAIEMSLAYNRNPDGGNAVLGSMNYEIMTDQQTEIDLLRRMIARFAGDPASVPDDPRMMEIMHRSMPGMGGGAGGHDTHGTETGGHSGH